MTSPLGNFIRTTPNLTRKTPSGVAPLDGIGGSYFNSSYSKRGARDVVVGGSNSIVDDGDMYRYAANQFFVDKDGAIILHLDAVTNAINYLKLAPAISGVGPTFVVQSSGLTPDTNAPINFYGLGTGAINFGNGAGVHLSVIDNGLGTAVNEYFTITGAPTSGTSKIASLGNGAIGAAASKVLEFRIGDQVHARVANTAGDSTTNSYLTLSGRNSATPRIDVTSSDTNRGILVVSKGTASVSFLNAGGSQTLLTIDSNSNATGAVNNFLMRTNTTGNAPTFRSTGDANAHLKIGPASGGTGNLQCERPDFINSAGASGTTYNTPTTGFSLTLSDNTCRTILTPAGTLAAGTVTTNATPFDGQEHVISTTQTITALTVAANSGQSLANGMPTTLTAGGSFRIHYRLSNTTWYVC